MKKILLSLLIVSGSVVSFAQDKNGSKGLAEVPRYYGVYVFDGLKPYYDYEVVDDIRGKSSFVRDVVDQSYETRVKLLAKKAKEKYPDCEAIILDLRGGSMTADRAEVIKFKQ